MTDLTLEELRSVIHYDPVTGEFTWLRSSGSGSAGKRAGGRTWRYERIAINGKQYSGHRLAWFYVHGEWPSEHIDHIDGDCHNNAIANLRSVPCQINQRNKALRCTNKSGVSGVYKVKATGRWCAQIRNLDGQLKHIGMFDCLDEAASARRAAERRYGFHENHGRSGTPGGR